MKTTGLDASRLWMLYESAIATRDYIVSYGSREDFARTSDRFKAADAAVEAARKAWHDAK